MFEKDARMYILARNVKNIKERISTCEICLSHADSQMKEPIIQHDIGGTPWSKIGAGLCELHGRMLLVVTESYSNFISVKRLNSTTTTAVSKQLMELFSRTSRYMEFRK